MKKLFPILKTNEDRAKECKNKIRRSIFDMKLDIKKTTNEMEKYKQYLRHVVKNNSNPDIDSICKKLYRIKQRKDALENELERLEQCQLQISKIKSFEQIQKIMKGLNTIMKTSESLQQNTDKIMDDYAENMDNMHVSNNFINNIFESEIPNNEKAQDDIKKYVLNEFLPVEEIPQKYLPKIIQIENSLPVAPAAFQKVT